MDYNLWQQLILGATKPFRTGANILAQNYGSAFTGKDMSKKQNQGKFLRWLAGGLTPEEQKEITEKPLKEAVKSAAGIATVAGPAGGSNIANVVLNNAIKNALYSASSSDTGNELKDAISGAAMGTILSGGGAVAKYLAKPKLTNSMIGKVITGAQRIGRGTDIDVPFAQKGELGYDPAVTKLVRKYSNVISPKNFRELLESIYPENLGKIGQYTGPQISGGTVIQPFTDTSGLGSNKWKWILRGLSTLGLPASTSYIKRNKGK